MNLTAERMNRGLSRKQAAEEIGIARATLIAAEEGRSIHEGSAKKIADFFEVRVTDIWPATEPNGEGVAA